ncbi:hypothetical protein GYB57_10200 [bacterium]|nr:hypothetical protein [bacterium]
MGKIKNLLFQVFGYIHFTVNVLLIVPPLTYTSLFSTLLLPKMFKRKSVLIGLGVVSSIFVFYSIIHFINGVDLNYYLKSTLFMCFLSFSTLAIYVYLESNLNELAKLFKFLPFVVFGIFVLGIGAYFTDFDHLFWKLHNFEAQGQSIPRYMGLSYEPSYYALSITPVFIFCLLKLLFNVTFRNLGIFILVSIPILATLSFGFFIASFMALVLSFGLIYLLFKEFKRVLIWPIAMILVSLVAVNLSDNAISKRIELIINGNDTSVNGRTVEAFYLGYKCAEQKSVLMGIGPGQIKIIGEEVIRPYYAAWAPIGYSKENWPILSIPNSSAETLAIYGVLGLILRFTFQLFLFFKFKVYRNYFNLILFIFIFVYQLMGGFITSSMEYVLWIFAILPIFPEFNLKQEKKIISFR